MVEHGDVRARLDRDVAIVRSHTPRRPRVALVLGSGLGAFADTVDGRVAVSYGALTGVPASRVPGHAGNLVLGEIEGVDVVAMQGRAHLYEGHSPDDVVFGTRLMVALGADVVIVTNAAGGVDERFEPGDIMVIDDHLNLTGRNCLVGANDDSLGQRFVDMTVAYDRALRDLAKREAQAMGLELRHGVYAGLLGPTYETPAEVRMVRTLGAHAVGMSTVLEVIAARHMGARVLGLSCITNQAAGISGALLSHDEVKETADRVRESFVRLLRGLVRGIGAS